MAAKLAPATGATRNFIIKLAVYLLCIFISVDTRWYFPQARAVVTRSQTAARRNAEKRIAYEHTGRHETNPPGSELSSYGLKYSDINVDVIGGEIFDHMDIYYHDYYTSHLGNFSNIKDCKKGDFICPPLPGSYGLCFSNTDGLDNICDGTNDCLNGADESMCTYLRENGGSGDPTNLFKVLYKKEKASFSCNKRVGVPDDWQCDGYCDCIGCLDEEKDDCRPSDAAKKLCEEGPLRCNGWMDCMDGSDELGCKTIKKVDGRYPGKNEHGAPLWSGFFPCDDMNITQQWYSRRFQCDGKMYCTDGSDEKDCDGSKPLPITYSTRDTMCSNYDGLLCRPGPNQPLICIRETDICSLHWENEEFKCLDKVRINSKVYNLEQHLVHAQNHSMCTGPDRQCLREEFKCRDQYGNYKCLPGIKLYDNVKDCYNPNDISMKATNSSFWGKTVKTAKDLLGKTTTKTTTDVDDDTNSADYPNDEDPALKAKNDKQKKEDICGNCPNNDKDRCAQFRIFSYKKETTGNVCDCRCVECHVGYEVNQDTGICQDRNECDFNKIAAFHHPCSHGCLNTPGSYYCACPAGLILGLDGHTCRPLNAKEHPISLYIAQSKQVQRLELSIGNITDTKRSSRIKWDVTKQETIFTQNASMFTAIAIDENDDIYSDTASGNKEKAFVYFGSYRKIKGQNGPIIYRWDQKKAAQNSDYQAEIYYRFNSGVIEGMAFDYITKNLHVTLSSYRLKTQCELASSGNKQSTSVVGMHVIIPTKAKPKHNDACKDCVGPVPFFAHHVNLKKPRALVVIPERATVIIVDWLGNTEKRSLIHKVHFGDLNSADFHVTSKYINMQYLNAAVYDKYRHRVLLFDAKKRYKGVASSTRESTIMSCDINFTKCRHMASHPSNWLFSATLLGKDIFFAEMRIPQILVMNRFNPADATILRRFDKTVYGMALQNAEIQTKSHAVQNSEICGEESNSCDYMCVTHSLKTFTESLNKRTYHGNDTGIMGAMCLCPDGSTTTDVGKTCKTVKEGLHKVSHAGFVLTNANMHGSHLRVYDIEKGSSAHRYLQLQADQAKYFNTSSWRAAEFYNPIDNKIYKWDPERNIVHQLEIKAISTCKGAVPINQLSGSPVAYSSYKSMDSKNITIKAYDFEVLADTWLEGYTAAVRMYMKTPVVVEKLGIVCGMTYTVQYPREYIVYCTKVKDFVRPWSGGKKKAIAIYTSSRPFSFTVDEVTLFVLNRYSGQFIFHDLYEMASGTPFHKADIRAIQTKYMIRSNLYNANGIKGRVILSNRYSLFEYDYAKQKNKDANGTVIGDSVKVLLNMTEVYPREKWCNSSVTYVSGFDDVTVIGDRVYGAWSAECRVKNTKSTTSYSYYGYKYLKTSVMFSCSQAKAGEVLADCAIVKIEPEDHTNTASVRPYWHFFVDMEKKRPTQIKCNDTCEYFCALDTSGTGGNHCICPTGWYFDKATKKCVKQKNCFDTCISKADGKKLCITDEMICDGKAQCADEQDEEFCQPDGMVCGENEFDCQNNGTKVHQCIPYTNVCDGTKQCKSTGLDEANKTCKATLDSCKVNGQYVCSKYPGLPLSISSKTDEKDYRGFCIPFGIVGDGKIDCSMASKYRNDESYGATRAKCNHVGKFHCRGTLTCISNNTRCDGIHDCGIYKSKFDGSYRQDKSDERSYSCRYANLTCPEMTHFFCKSSHQCLRPLLVCNGHKDCPEGEDESDAACKKFGKEHPKPKLYHHTGTRERDMHSEFDFYFGYTCKSKLFCNTAKSSNKQVCLKYSQLCDGTKDCLDGSDEDGVGTGTQCKNACLSLTAKEKKLCGECTPTPTGPRCSCPNLPGDDDMKRLTGIGTSNVNCTYINFCKEYVGTCDQICKFHDGIDERTKGPYRCSCQSWIYQLSGDRFQHCSRSSPWKVAALNRFGQVQTYEMDWVNGSHLISVGGDELNATLSVANKNTQKRSIDLSGQDHRGSTVHTFTIDADAGHVYTVEMAPDKFDVIYVHPTRGDANWDLIITLPQLWVDSIAPGFSHKDYSYLFVGATLPTAKNQVAYALYAVALSGNPARLVSRLPDLDGKKTTHVLQRPIKHIVHVADQDRVYFSHGKELWYYDLILAKPVFVYDFVVPISAMVHDSGWWKMFISTADGRVYHLSHHHCGEAKEVYLQPPAGNITSISVYEDKLAFTIDNFTSPQSIYNKFTGLELTKIAEIRKKLTPILQVIGHTMPYPIKFINYYEMTRNRRSSTWKTTLDDRIKNVTNTTDVLMCPQNTFNLLEKTARHSYSHCLCLGWTSHRTNDPDSDSPVPAIKVSEYNNTFPCDKPRCDASAFLRYPTLRRAMAGKRITDKDPSDGMFEEPMSALDELDDDSNPIDSTSILDDIYDVDGVLNKLLLDLQNKSAKYQSDAKKVVDASNLSQKKKTERKNLIPADSDVFKQVERLLSLAADPEHLLPDAEKLRAKCQPGLTTFNYGIVKYKQPRWSHSKKYFNYTSAKENIAKTNDTIEYQCNRIGEFSGDSKHTNTYHLHIDGAFVGGPDFGKRFENHSKNREAQRFKGYSYGSYKQYLALYGITHSEFFGPSFTGQYCDFAKSYTGTLDDNFFRTWEQCNATGCSYCKPFYIYDSYKTYYGSNETFRISGNISAKAEKSKKYHCAAVVSRGNLHHGMKTTSIRDQYRQEALDQLANDNSSGAGSAVLITVIVVLLLAGCVGAVVMVRKITFPSSPYNNNQKFSYQDLDEDRDNSYPDDARKLPSGDVCDERRRPSKYDPTKSSSTLANDDFDGYAVQSCETGQLIETEACMGFNIPKNTADWGAPPAFESPERDTNALICNDVEEPLPKKSVVTNPFFGGSRGRHERSNSQTPIIDL